MIGIIIFIIFCVLLLFFQYLTYRNAEIVANNTNIIDGHLRQIREIVKNNAHAIHHTLVNWDEIHEQMKKKNTDTRED